LETDLSLAIDNASKAYGDKNVLSHVSLELVPGTITALLGRSGSGKTTLMRALSLIEPPDSGIVRFLGFQRFPTVNEQAAEPLWPSVTVVFQDLFLWPHMTCRQNIEFPITVGNGDDDIRRVDELVEKLGISALLDRRPSDISRGQRQLVALARSLCVRPKVILLDEVTASLDVESASVVGMLFQELKAQGLAIMFISHDMNFVSRFSDRYVFMDDGEIVESGKTSELASSQNPLIRRLLGRGG
jgi:ABC-type multidrug transport system ATPase subunit